MCKVLGSIPNTAKIREIEMSILCSGVWDIEKSVLIERRGFFEK
jgi:hypothetical protein